MKEDKTKQGENDDMKEYAENEVKDSKKKNNNKSTKKKSSNVLPILIILLIVSILISGLIIYNSQRLNNSENIDKVAEDKNIENKTDISNGMKRYTSSKYSIEFDYPAELIFIDDLYYVSEKPEDGKLAALSIAKDGGRNPLVYMSFLHLNNNNCEIQSIIEDIEWEGDYILGKVVIDGVESDFVEGYKSFEEGISSYYKEICYINDEKSVSIRFVDDEANSNKLILDDFLKSINFIEWKTYTNTNLNFLISYPENWEIDAQEIEDENPENGEKIYGINLEISNMGYKFVYDIPAGGFGGQKCVYGDEEFDGPQVQLDEYYMELLKGEDRFRRAKVVNNYDDTKIAYQICGGGNNDFYSDIVYDGRVSYYFTGSISQDMLDLLDQIFLSMEKLDWKTYTGEMYKVSFDYPATATLNSIDDCSKNGDGPCMENFVMLKGFTYPIGGMQMVFEDDIDCKFRMELSSDNSQNSDLLRSKVVIDGREFDSVARSDYLWEGKKYFNQDICVENGESSFMLVFRDELDRPNKDIFRKMIESMKL